MNGGNNMGFLSNYNYGCNYICWGNCSSYRPTLVNPVVHQEKQHILIQVPTRIFLIGSTRWFAIFVHTQDNQGDYMTPAVIVLKLRCMIVMCLFCGEQWCGCPSKAWCTVLHTDRRRKLRDMISVFTELPAFKRPRHIDVHKRTETESAPLKRCSLPLMIWYDFDS